MMQRRGIWDRFAEQADLPGEVMPGQPLLELAGDRRVLIENHNGVTEYSREKIRVRVKYGEVAVCGYSLELACMSCDQLVITGRIESITLCRRGK